LHGIAPVGLDLVAGLLRDQRGGHHPAEEALLGEVAIEPIAAGAGLVHKDQLSAFGVEPADELINVALAGPDGTEVQHLGVFRIGDIGNRDGFLMDTCKALVISSSVARMRKCLSLANTCPLRSPARHARMIL